MAALTYTTPPYLQQQNQFKHNYLNTIYTTLNHKHYEWSEMREKGGGQYVENFL